MSSSNCCFLTCIQISQEAGQVVWYSHLFENLPQFIVIHTVKGFGIVNKAEIDVFLELFHFFDDPAHVVNLISGSSAFSKTSLNIWKFTVHVYPCSTCSIFNYFELLFYYLLFKGTSLQSPSPLLETIFLPFLTSVTLTIYFTPFTEHILYARHNIRTQGHRTRQARSLRL